MSRTDDVWRELQAAIDRADAAEAEAADLRRQLAEHDSEASAACQDWDGKCQELEALIPKPEWLEHVAKMVKIERCGTCPVRDDCPIGGGPADGWLCETVPARLRELAAKIEERNKGDA